MKFLGLEIYKRESVLLISEGVFLSLFFFLVNIMGTYLGYGISKTLSYNLINRESLQDVLTTYVAGTIFFIIAGLIGHLFRFLEFEVFIFIGIGAVLFFIGTWQLLKLPEKQ